MTGYRKTAASVAGLLILCIMVLNSGLTVRASSLDDLSGGVAAVLSAGTAGLTTAQTVQNTEEETESKLVMANVQNALNVRSGPSEDADKVGKLYKDCGGTILERQDGWTKLRSGNIVGWASDEYLLFDEEAEALANDVGRMMATVNTETLRVRTQADENAEVMGLLPKGEILEVLDDGTGEWVLIDYEGEDGYVLAEYVDLNFQIDAGETIEEIKAREAEEAEAKRNVNYGEYTTDADTTRLLAALVYCEAGGEPYEGQLAVAAVVMNRVRSGAYPDSIHGVIYASGQFTPALNGKVNAKYESGNIPASCIQAAEEAISGVSNVGDCTHFRRNNGTREGIVIGNHVFY